MNKLLRFCPLFLISLVVLVSCAKEETENSDSIEKRILDAHIKVVYDNSIQPTSSGLYIIKEVEGTGAPVTANSGIFVRYSTLDLKHNYLSTTYDNLAKTLGGYSDTTYYGPRLFVMGNYSMIRGLEEGLLNMKEGSKTRLIVPSWLSDYNYSGSTKLNSSTTIYDIEILKIVDDVSQFQIDSLEAYSAKYYGDVDSLSNGYYFKSLSEGIGDTLAVGDVISYWYVGKLLDGFVFDTNIEDTARKYKIYDASKSYVALEQTLQDPDNNDGTVINGMAKTLLNMKHGGKAVTFFHSGWGYGSTQMAFGIYQPLFFYVEVVTDNDDDTD
ncbi:MAG: FKBP-type peptidyl-prolyl cis-trans isomerase [Bacteroidales bacterium]